MKRLLTGIILILFAGIAGASPLGLDRIYPVQQKDFESFQQKFNSSFGYSVDKNFNKLELTLNPIFNGTTGDIIYSLSTGALTKLNIGAAGQHLVSRGGVPSWEALPAGGTVTQINTGTGLTGGPITTTGTLSIDSTVVQRQSDTYSDSMIPRIFGTSGNMIKGGPLSVDNSGNMTGLTSLLFTASGSNTLQYYDEGTWSPTVTSQVGSITSYTASGTFTRIGNICVDQLHINITDNGTGATALKSTLSHTSSAQIIGCGRDNGVSGKMIQGYNTGSSNILFMRNYDDSYPGATNADIYMLIVYLL